MQRLGRVIAAALILASALGAFDLSSARAIESPPPPKFRLPADVVRPARYRLELTASRTRTHSQEPSTSTLSSPNQARCCG